MEKKVYERPVLEMISFEAKETLANGGDNMGSWPGSDWDPMMAHE